MGQDYEGVVFYGLLFDQFGEDDDDHDWPAETRAVLGGGDDPDFSRWLPRALGVAPWWVDMKRVRTHEDFTADLKARCLERFGVEGFESSWLGHLDYPVWVVHPVGAERSAWRGARFPTFYEPALLTEWEGLKWRAACEKLREMLPGAGEPGFFYGCRVG